MVKAVEANVATGQRWVVLYAQRWLTAPLQLPDGTLAEWDRETPQGSAVSPVLADLFMHYAFNSWLVREFPSVEFERCADDAVVHCVTERQACQVWAALAVRMDEVGLRLRPDKTKIVYCKDANRRGSFAGTSFTFLGFRFCPRTVTSQHGVLFTGFALAISSEALKAIRCVVRGWRIHTRTRNTLEDLADLINPIVRGWMTYYGRFFRSKLHPLLKRINGYLVRQAREKYKWLASFKRVMSYQEIEEMMAERGVIVSYNAKAAARFFRKLLTKFALRATGADHRQLASYGVAHRRLIPSVEHRRSKYLNNRAETPTSPPGSENGR